MTDPQAHVAVVDIGSNSVRIVVYDALARAPLPRFNEKSLCRLGEGVDEEGEIGAGAIERVLTAVRRFRAIADAMQVERVDVLATEAMRRARNGADVAKSIEDASGFAVRILTGPEEARYAGLGVVSGFWRPTGMVGDMGGGSLEIAEVVEDRVGERSVSLPVGALPVQAMLAEDAKAARKRIDALLKERLPPLLTTEPVFYAVGGGWRALAKVHMDAVRAPVRVVHGYGLAAKELRRFAKSIWKMPAEELARMPGVPSRRAATLPAAALLLDRLLKRLEPDRVVISALGLREGWLYDQLPAKAKTLDPLLEGARELGVMVARVPAFAAALERWTEGFFPGETAADRRLRAAACLVSDIAWRDHPGAQADEAFRRVVQFPFVGIEHAERVFLGAVLHARYAGGANPSELAPALDLLTPSERRRALVLGRMLLLGHRLSASVPAILDAATVRVTAEAVRLEIAHAASIPDGDAVQGRLDLLAKALGVAETDIRTATD